jgi:hypothetical protein
MHHHEYGASYTGTVVLDIGQDRGALVIFTGADQVGDEIEISPAAPGAPECGPRTHAAVRERHLDGRTLYGAVYPGLREGSYTIWSDEVTPVGTVLVRGAEIAEFRWPS